MGSKYRSGDCLICEQYTPHLHWHHTVPQALGGKDSLQIPLCGNCHTTLHAIAKQVVTSVKNGDISKTISQWPSSTAENNAEQYLNILIEAELGAKTTPLHNKTYKVVLEIPERMYSNLKILKEDMGIEYTSIQKTILACIENEIKKRGLKDGKESKTEMRRVFWLK